MSIAAGPVGKRGAGAPAKNVGVDVGCWFISLLIGRL
tara:strand:+ start:1742 stop:1852 length:111 start_codon:yes stop_codon:yes gene_type:complete